MTLIHVTKKCKKCLEAENIPLTDLLFYILKILDPYTQWISLLYRRVQKIDEIQPDHCDIYQKNHNKNAIEWHWTHTSDLVGPLVKV